MLNEFKIILNQLAINSKSDVILIDKCILEQKKIVSHLTPFELKFIICMA